MIRRLPGKQNCPNCNPVFTKGGDTLVKDTEEKIIPLSSGRNNPRRRARKVSKFRIFFVSLLFAAILLGLIAFVVFRDDISASTAAELAADLWNRLTSGDTHQPLLFSDFMLGKAELFRDHLALLSPSNLSVFSLSGRHTLQEELSLHTPALAASDRTLAIYDRGGHEIIITGTNTVLWRQTLPAPILTVRMNPKGDFVAVTFPEGASSRATLYNASYEPQYQWDASSFYIVDAAVSDKADKLALIAMGLSGAEMTGRLLILDTQSETPLFTHDFSGELPRHVAFVREGLVTVITDSHVYTWADGQLTKSYSYADAQLQDFVVCREATALLTADTGANSQIIWLDNKGQLVGQYDFEGDFVLFSLSTDNLFVWHNERLFRYRRDQTQADEQPLPNVKKILARLDNSVVALFENSAQILTFS